MEINVITGRMAKKGRKKKEKQSINTSVTSTERSVIKRAVSRNLRIFLREDLEGISNEDIVKGVIMGIITYFERHLKQP